MREYRKTWTPAQKENNRRSQKKWRDANREVINERNRIRYEENPEVFYGRRVKSDNSHPAAALLANARRNALRKHYDFNLDLEDIHIPEMCPLLKIPMGMARGQGHTWDAITIDRIDSAKGYVKGNVQVLSRKANMMKSNATKAELIQFAKSILEWYDE